MSPEGAPPVEFDHSRSGGLPQRRFHFALSVTRVLDARRIALAALESRQQLPRTIGSGSTNRPGADGLLPRARGGAARRHADRFPTSPSRRHCDLPLDPYTEFKR